MKIRMNPHDGGFPKRPKMFILSFKLSGFGGSGVKIGVNLRGGFHHKGEKS